MMAERPLAVSAADLHFAMTDEGGSSTADVWAPDHSYHGANGYEEANGHEASDGDPHISWPLERSTLSPEWKPETHAASQGDFAAHASNPVVLYEELLPGHKRSLSSISLQSFFLGVTLGLCIPLILFVGLKAPVPQPPRAWRIYFLLSVLSIFHFLEFWTHARFNVPKATTSAFILFNNGWQYTAANALTLMETAVTSLFFPQWQTRFSYPPAQAIALGVMVLGQVCRSAAMAQAGTNFNHKVQTKRSQDHILVTNGIYSWLRHPSYFGFFWWAVAMQVFLGNAICFWVYVLVLWEFFNHRIAHEEEHLVTFFGDEYRRYRARTWLGIPFIK